MLTLAAILLNSVTAFGNDENSARSTAPSIMQVSLRQLDQVLVQLPRYLVGSPLLL